MPFELAPGPPQINFKPLDFSGIGDIGSSIADLIRGRRLRAAREDAMKDIKSGDYNSAFAKLMGVGDNKMMQAVADYRAATALSPYETAKIGIDQENQARERARDYISSIPPAKRDYYDSYPQDAPQEYHQAKAILSGGGQSAPITPAVAPAPPPAQLPSQRPEVPVQQVKTVPISGDDIGQVPGATTAPPGAYDIQKARDTETTRINNMIQSLNAAPNGATATDKDPNSPTYGDKIEKKDGAWWDTKTGKKWTPPKLPRSTTVSETPPPPEDTGKMDPQSSRYLRWNLIQKGRMPTPEAARANLKAVDQTMNNTRRQVEKLLKNPHLTDVFGGLSNMMFQGSPMGPWPGSYNVLPSSVTAGTPAATAHAQLEGLKNQISTVVINQMRELSGKSGSLGIGRVLQAEFGAWQNFFGSLNQIQDVDSAKETLQSILDYMDEAKKRREDAYKDDYRGLTQ